ncbi:MAG: restriction endonuclease [Chloroflexota bacterium]|nr:restriction endonuclease [Chloroflexota bacterium]
MDLIYLDPPFNSNQIYNVIFPGANGLGASAQIQAFTDTWTWDQSAMETLVDIRREAPARVVTIVDALCESLRESNIAAYIVMMTARLIHLHRVLKDTGSLYLHCDPTASHYLKVILDVIFGPRNFRNEIVWRRTGSHNNLRRYGPIHDTILFYTKSDDYVWNNPTRPYMRSHVEANFVLDENGYRTNYYGNVLTGSGVRNGESGRPWRGFDPTAKGRHWAVPGKLIADIPEDFAGLTQHEKLDRLFELGHIKITPGHAWPIYQRYIRPGDGQLAPDIWAYQPYTEGLVFGTENGIDADVRWLSPHDQERLKYPTQKPLALLERIIRASSEPDQVVLDPFCGCGTSIVAAESLGRRWIGIDITSLATTVIENRLDSMFESPDFQVRGLPTTVEEAAALALRSRFQFQWWAIGRVGAIPTESQEKKGADEGIDGLIRFFDDRSGKPKHCVVSVKSGKNVEARDVRDLVGTVESNKAQAGVLITLTPPTKPMRQAAARAGMYYSPLGHDYPKIQIFTVDDLFNERIPDLPDQENQRLRRKQRAVQRAHQQQLPAWD